MGDDDDAKDVLQDAFIHAFGNIKKLRDANMFSAWIKRIVINHCINALKKKSIVTVELEAYGEIQEPSDTNDQDLIQVEAQRILSAIDRISDGCKTVLNLYLFEGYDHKEIAEILSISVSASKAQYSKAKAKIRKLIMEEKTE